MHLKRLSIYCVVCLMLFAFYATFFIQIVMAQSMSNDSFIIHGGNFNSFAGEAKGPLEKIKFSSGQTATGKSNNSNFTIKTGFEYLKSKDSFVFSLSSPTVNFGDIKAGEPVTRTNALTVTLGSATGFQVLASEDHEPQIMPGGVFVPDTTCDEGTCTETTAANWASPLTYGFGFRCDNTEGNACSSEFENKEAYKQFANSSKNETSQTIMIGDQAKGRSQSKINYKINIPQTQPAGVYQNNILYIAIPKL